MDAQKNIDFEFEIGHVLFIDVVGYTKLAVDDQREILADLNRMVRETPTFRAAERTGKLSRLPTGDGMALVFFTSPEAPAHCAVELAKALRDYRRCVIRMGLHSGPVSGITDVNDHSNIAGAGINIAQRVMDCGDAGHILLSRHIAEDLENYRFWRPYLHSLGECEVKHGQRLGLVNLYSDEVGNAETPAKVQAAATRVSDAANDRASRSGLLLTVLIALSLIGIVVSLLSHRSGRSIQPEPGSSVPGPAVSDKSIAVLPLENLSDDKQNTYFADGVQDQILTNLAKVSDLRVISHTSVRQYKSGVQRNVREIGQQLGVAYVVEGSVQRSGDSLRINAQLIDARTDTHIWGETYDRTAADLFAIQSELAQAIAGQLKAKISPQQKAEIEERPTQDLVAFQLYTQAKTIIDSYINAEDVRAALLQALQSLDQAIKRDPNFVSAYCYAARANDLLYFFDLDPTQDRVESAEGAVKVARNLRGDSAEVHFTRGDFLFRCRRDYEGAQEELTLARPGLPNSTPFFILSGYINRRRNRFPEAERDFSTAMALDPRNPNAYNLLSDTYFLERRYAESVQNYARVLAAGEQTPIVLFRKASSYFYGTGDSNALRDILTKVPEMDVAGGQTPARVLLALMDNNFAEAERVLAASPRQDFQDIDFSFYFPKSWYEAMIARAKGDGARATDAFQKTRAILEQRLTVKPEHARTIAVLAQVDAALGRKDLALREAQHAVDLMPLSKDIYDGALVLEGLAQVYTWSGDRDRALETVEKLVSIPSYTNYARLRFHPLWAPLRGDPRFEKIVNSLGPQKIGER
jgi:TolB-like protein/Tfp pilus assembly protein PilF